MDQQTLESVARKLEQRKHNIEERISRLRQTDPHNWDRRDLDNAPFDDATEAEEHRRVEALLGEETDNLLQITHALSQIAVGDYGVCEVCGGDIDPARLETWPGATRCMRCEQRQEQKIS